MADSSSFEALNPYQMCDKAAAVMAGKAIKPAGKAFLLAVMAGVFIGLGFVYCAIANASGAGKIVGGLVFSLGLMLVIVLGADLFTSTTMTLFPVPAEGSPGGRCSPTGALFTLATLWAA